MSADLAAYRAGAPCHPRSAVVRLSDAPDYNVPFAYDCARRYNSMPRLRRAGALSEHLRAEWRFFLPYERDMASFCAMARRGARGTYAVQFGDRKAEPYVLAKSRAVAGEGGGCRGAAAVQQPSTPGVPPRARRAAVERKRDDVLAVWRGVTTGSGLRRTFVRALYRNHDVKFSAVVQHKRGWITDARQLAKSPMTKRDMLRFRYILSLGQRRGHQPEVAVPPAVGGRHADAEGGGLAARGAAAPVRALRAARRPA